MLWRVVTTALALLYPLYLAVGTFSWLIAILGLFVFLPAILDWRAMVIVRDGVLSHREFGVQGSIELSALSSVELERVAERAALKTYLVLRDDRGGEARFKLGRFEGDRRLLEYFQARLDANPSITIDDRSTEVLHRRLGIDR